MPKYPLACSGARGNHFDRNNTEINVLKYLNVTSKHCGTFNPTTSNFLEPQIRKPAVKTSIEISTTKPQAIYVNELKKKKKTAEDTIRSLEFSSTKNRSKLNFNILVEMKVSFEYFLSRRQQHEQ